MSRTVLILGGSMHQLICIEHAVEAGYTVHCIDYFHDSVGHAASSVSHVESTTDEELVLRIAREAEIDGILCPGTDVAVPSLARVVAEMHLTGPCRAAAGTMCNKGALNEFLHAHGFNAPLQFRSPADWQTLGPAERDRQWIVKPECSSGSKGVTVTPGPESVLDYISAAEAVSMNGHAVIAEFLGGRQCTAEGFLADGQIAYLVITDRITAEWPYTATHGHVLPSPAAGEMEATVRDTLVRFFEAVGYTAGPFDCDFVFQDEKMYILEVSPRLGGNFISSGVKIVDGLDLYDLNLQFACGDKVNIPTPARDKQVYIILLGLPESGQLVYDPDAWQSVLDREEVMDGRMFFNPGEEVLPHTTGAGCLGFVIVDPAGCDSMAACKQDVCRAMSLSVESPSK